MSKSSNKSKHADLVKLSPFLLPQKKATKSTKPVFETLCKMRVRMNFQKVDDLNNFVDEVNDYLCNVDNHKQVSYELLNITPWNSEALVTDNELLLASASGVANIYAIFCSVSGADNHILRYIGKSTKKLARQRIRNHLIKKHEKTGAKLSKVIDHVQAGGSIRIVWVEIEPESLRNCIEEELIRKHPEANWNRENA